MMRRCLWAALTALLLMLPALAQAQIVKVRGVWDGVAETYQEIQFDLVNGYPILQCTAPPGGNDVNVHDGAANAIDSRTGALSVVQEDGSGALVAVATEATVATLATEATAATLATEATLATMCLETTAADIETNTDYGAVVGGGAEATALRVTLANNSTGLVSVDDGGGSLTVDGTFWQATQPISAAALPLPAGASTSALQLPDGHNVTNDNAAGAAAVNIQDGGNTITVDAAALPLPAGASTSALQLPDGHNVTIDNAAAGAAVNVQDGGNSITVDGTFWQATQPVSAAALPLPAGASTEATLAAIETLLTAGTIVDSASVGQQGSWIDVTDGSSPDGNFGVIPNGVIAAGTPVKMYALPTGKLYHEIAITYTDSAVGDFEYDMMVLATNDVPTVAWALADWMDVGALVVPSWKLSRDRTETTIAQPLLRTHATYLIFIVDVAAVVPASDPQVRILSYNAGDTP